MKTKLLIAVSLSTITALPAAAQSPAAPYVARGTEPFWSLKIDGRTMRFEAPGRRAVSVTAPRANKSPGGESWRTKRIQVRSNRARCSDGMSDQSYPDTVTVTVDGRTYRGCGGDPIRENHANALNGEWVIAAINGRNVARGSTPRVEFRDGQISGNASCNNYSGRYTYRQGALNVGQLAVTRRACSGREVSRQEQAILALFNSQLRVDSRGHANLTITGARNQSLRLVRRINR